MAEQTGGATNPDGQQQSGAGGGQSQQQQQTPSGGGQQQQQPGSGSGEKTFSFKEDRTDWTPRHRLNEESTKRTAAEKERDDYKAKLEAAEKRTRIALGVEEVDAKTKDAEEIRNAIYALIPEIGALKGLTQDQLQEVLEAARVARTSASATWERHTSSVLDLLDTEASDSMKVEKLTPTQQTRLRRAYRDEVMGAMQERQVALERGERQTLDTTGQDNDLVARHERGDKALIKGFVKAYLADWYEPARRSVSAQLERRNRPVPRGERTILPLTQGEKKVDLTDNNEFKKALIAARGSSE